MKVIATLSDDSKVELIPKLPDNVTKIWILSDTLLPKYHEYYPVRVSAPAPCVFDVHYPYAIPITEPWQWLIVDSLSYSKYGESFSAIGGRYTEEGARILQAFEHLLSTKLAFCNGDAGFGGETPKINVPAGISGDEWPRFDKARVCGGNTFLGRVDGTDVVLEYFEHENPPVYTPQINSDYRMFEATQIYAEGAVRVFPGLDACPQFLPLISRYGEPIRYPLAYVRLYTGETLSPYYPLP